MRKMTSDEIRDTWLEFFKSKEHYIEPSASLVPNNDPTLLWINAGVAALKKYFDGSERPKHRRITNAQKCIRTNDIENVGYTARHHTFFEMLGNFSIGDYFRDEVIPWAAELLMNEKYFGFPADKLYVSYFPDDIKTKELWIKSGIAESHMIPLETNFWEIGEGPCGPDTEIYFDRGEKYDPENKGEELLRNDLENDRYIELWNIVFSQFNSKPGVSRSEYKELPSKNIDTGAGLERFACVIQEAETNFDTDLFMPYITWIKERSDKPYDGENKLAYRVIADHIRSVTFALADGAVFSNDGRGYVLRRLVRRAIRYANKLNLSTGSLSELVKVVCLSMSHFYPYLLDNQERVSKMVLSEEMKFAKTLKQGENMLNSYLEKSGNVLSGEDAFKLSDTYGFPLELTIEISSEKGKTVDVESYKTELENQKQRARNARGDRESFGSQSKDLMDFTTKSIFTYDEKVITSKVIALFKDGVKVDSLDSEGDVIFERTNFYAESGGQVSDIGEVKNDNCSMNVTGVIKSPNKQHLHHVDVLFGEVKVGDSFTLLPDFKRRQLTRCNHSAAHLLQAALQQCVSKDVHQAGSFVSPDMMRFDIAFDRKLTQEEIDKVEQKVNEVIREHIDCHTDLMEIEEAKKTGAMALFNEKYEDIVRVVSFGNYSKEFCAGTHVSNTSDLGVFVIASEEAISSGVRRIVAYTGLKAYEYLKEKQNELLDICKLVNVKSDREIISKLNSINNDKESMQNQIKLLQGKIVSTTIKEIKSSFEEYNDYHLYLSIINDFAHDQVVDLSKAIVNDDKSIVLLFNLKETKSELCVALGQNALKAGLKAGILVKSTCAVLNGSGGGKPDIAFGGFTSKDNIDEACKTFKELIR